MVHLDYVNNVNICSGIKSTRILAVIRRYSPQRNLRNPLCDNFRYYYKFYHNKVKPVHIMTELQNAERDQTPATFYY